MSMQLVHTSYHVIRDVDGKVMLTTHDFHLAKMTQIDLWIHSMACHIDTSTWHREVPSS